MSLELIVVEVDALFDLFCGCAFFGWVDILFVMSRLTR